METLCFKVADLCFALHAPEAKRLKQLLPSYAPFYLKACEEPFITEVTIAPGLVDCEAEGEELGQFDCGGTNHGIYRTADGYKIVISNVEGELSSAMTTNADFSRAEVSLFGSEEAQRFGIGNALMIVFAFAAATRDTLLMHASVTMQGGRGYLFLGKSGTGKSTHSMLWRKYIPGSDLLNDDNPAVRVMPDGEVRVFGTPWSGKTPCYRNLSLPAGAFLRLEQYPENLIQPEPVLHAFASVLSSCSTMIWDKLTYTAITKTVEQVVKATPAYYLRCRPDEEAARLSYQTLTAPYVCKNA